MIPLTTTSKKVKIEKATASSKGGLLHIFGTNLLPDCIYFSSIFKVQE